MKATMLDADTHSVCSPARARAPETSTRRLRSAPPSARSSYSASPAESGTRSAPGAESAEEEEQYDKLINVILWGAS